MKIAKVFVCVIIGTLLFEGVTCGNCEPLFNAIVNQKEVILDFIGWETLAIDKPNNFRGAGLQRFKDEFGVDFDNNSDLKQFICRLTDAVDLQEVDTLLHMRGKLLDEERLKVMSKYLLHLVHETVEDSVFMGWTIGLGFPNFPLNITYEKALSSDVRLGDTLGWSSNQEYSAKVAKALSGSQSWTDYEELLGYDKAEEYMQVLEFNFKAWPKRILAYIEIKTVARESGLLDLPFHQHFIDGLK